MTVPTRRSAPDLRGGLEVQLTPGVHLVRGRAGTPHALFDAVSTGQLGERPRWPPRRARSVSKPQGLERRQASTASGRQSRSGSIREAPVSRTRVIAVRWQYSARNIASRDLYLTSPHHLAVRIRVLGRPPPGNDRDVSQNLRRERVHGSRERLMMIVIKAIDDTPVN